MQSITKDKIAFALTVIYVVLVLLSLIPVFTGDDPLDAIFFIMLTFPWSFLMNMLVDNINPALFDNIVIPVITGLVAAAVNAVLLYLLASWMGNRFKRNN